MNERERQWAEGVLGTAPWLKLKLLGTNLATAGMLSEAARRARLRCPECGVEPCGGNHPGLAGPCCVCCPVSPVATEPGDE